MGISNVLICSACADAAGPESAAQEDAASAPFAFSMDWEFRAEAVLAEVMMRTSPSALAVATAVELEFPDEAVEVLDVLFRAAAAALAASPEENVVVTTRACWPEARAVALVKEFPPSCELESDDVVMLRGADGLMEVNCVV
jgi:hypothetical protein